MQRISRLEGKEMCAKYCYGNKQCVGFGWDGNCDLFNNKMASCIWSRYYKLDYYMIARTPNGKFDKPSCPSRTNTNVIAYHTMYRYRNNTEMAYSDLKEIKSVPIKSCLKSCNDRSSCKAVIYSQNLRRCWLKKTKDTGRIRSNYPDRDLYQKMDCSVHL